MKILQTSYSNLPLQDVVKLEFGDTLKITQLDNTGIYTSTYPWQNTFSGEFIVDKKDLYNALDILGDHTKIMSTQTSLIFNKDGIKIKVKLITDKEFNMNIPMLEYLHDLPENFVKIFKEASKFAGENDQRQVLNTIHIAKDKIESTNSYVMYKKDIELGLSGDVAIPQTALSVIDNPTKYAIVDDSFYISDGINIGKISLFDGEYPDLEQALNEMATNLKKIDINANELKTATSNIIKLDKDKIKLSGNSLMSDDEEYSQNVNYTFENSMVFGAKLLNKSIINGIIELGENCALFSDEDTKILVLKMRW